MLIAQDVSFKYIGAERSAVCGANTSLEQGSLNVVWGDNGSGKSTLALILAGVVPRLIRGDFSGAVSLRGRSISGYDLSSTCSVVFQDPGHYLRAYTVAEELRLIGVDTHRLSPLAARLLGGLTGAERVAQLSGGQRQRLALCSAFLRKTPVAVFDEPFENLDDSGIATALEVMRLIADSDRICIVVHRPVDEVNTNWDSAWQVADGRVQSREPVVDDPLPALPDLRHGPIILDCEKVALRHRDNEAYVFSPLSLELQRGESVGLLGENGSGKTTAAKLLAGLLPRSAGRLRVAGRIVDGRELRALVRCAFQNPESQIFGTSVGKEFDFGLRNLHVSDAEIQARRKEFLIPTGFDVASDPMSLSFGQKKVLTIACVLAMRPQVVVLDELSAGLDRSNRLLAQRLLDVHLARGGAAVATGHSLSDVRGFCHRAVRI